jgi:hypothetical protein
MTSAVQVITTDICRVKLRRPKLCAGKIRSRAISVKEMAKE